MPTIADRAFSFENYTLDLRGGAARPAPMIMTLGGRRKASRSENAGPCELGNDQVSGRTLRCGSMSRSVKHKRRACGRPWK